MKKTKFAFLLTLSAAFLLGACGEAEVISGSVSSAAPTSSSQPASSSESRPASSSEKPSSSEAAPSSQSSELPPVSSESSEEPPVSSESSEEPPVSSESSEEGPAISTTYTLTVGDAIVPLLDVSDWDKGEDTWVEQYYAEIDSVKAGDFFHFAKYGDSILPGASGEGNNLLFDPLLGLSVHNDAENVRLYFKVYEDGYDTWLTGYVADEEPPVSSDTSSSSEDPTGATYTLTIGDAIITLLDASDVEKGEDTWVEQYKAEIDHVQKGDVAVFKKDGDLIAPGASGKENNLVYNEETGLTVHNDADDVTLWFKVYEDGYDTWLTGYVAGEDPVDPVETGYYGPAGSEKVEWYLAGVGSLWEADDWSKADAVQLFSNPGSTDKACVLNISFEVGDAFKVTNYAKVWFGYEKVDPWTSDANLGLKNFEGADDGYDGQNFSCTVAGTYDMYINKDGVFWIQAHAK